MSQSHARKAAWKFAYRKPTGLTHVKEKKNNDVLWYLKFEHLKVLYNNSVINFRYIKHKSVI